MTLVRLFWNVKSSPTSCEADRPSCRKNVVPPVQLDWLLQAWKFGKVSGLTLGMPSCLAQSCPRVLGKTVARRRLYPRRASLIMVGLIDQVSESTTLR